MKPACAMIALSLAACGGDETASSSVDSSAQEATNEPTMTAAEFAQLETGMSYSEVAEIVGGEGEVMSESEMAGTRTVMYSWEGEGSMGANANAMFQNDELINKAQFGLE